MPARFSCGHSGTQPLPERSKNPTARTPVVASYGPDGALQIRMGGAVGSSGATGVNPGSRTTFRNVFTITNKGARPVNVLITGKSPAVTFRVGSTGTSLEREKVRLRPDRRSVHVGLVVDARAVEPGTDLLESVEIRTEPSNEGHANSAVFYP